ncbi:MAG: hypothetical protein AAB019_08340 [Planctomycetota bacterium]|mgnify:CR=1 FL=1
MKDKALKLTIRIILSAFIISLVSCATHYQLAQKHFDKARHYHQSKKQTKSLVEYSTALGKLSLIPDNHQGQFLRAEILHHLYSVDGIALWQKADESARNRCPVLAEIINHPNASADFLDQSFEQIKIINQKIGRSDISKLNQWFFVKKDEISGDFFYRRASEKFDNIPAEMEGTAPFIFIDKLRRYTLYRIAKNFYLSAWLKSNSLSETDSYHADLKATCRKKLQNVYWTLYAVSSSIPPGREWTQEFTLMFKNESRQFLEMMKKIEGVENQGQPDSGQLLGESLDENFLRLDADFHINEGRSKMSSAVEEVLRNKKDKAVEYLIEVLKHFILAKELVPPVEQSFFVYDDEGKVVSGKITPERDKIGIGLLENSLSDTYFQLHRLTKQAP